MKKTRDFSLAAGDGRLQATIDLASSQGGVVSLAPGLHEYGAILLRSGVTLHLEEGAVLRAVTGYDAFAAAVSGVVVENSDRAFLLAKGQRNVSITGKGVIEGQGVLWCSEVDPRSGARIPQRLRPRMLVVEDCEGFTLSGVTLRHSPLWTIHLVASRDITVQNVTVDNDIAQPNTDGIVVDSCTDVLIEDMSIQAADDSICMKTSARADGSTLGPCRRVTVRRVRAVSRGAAFKIGSETHDDFSDIVFEDCVAVEATRAINIMLRDGGSADNIAFRNIRVHTREVPIGYWGTGEAVSFTILNRRPGRRAVGAIRNVEIDGLTGRMQGAMHFVALDGGRITGLALRNVDLEQVPGPISSGKYCDLRPTLFGLALPEGATGLGNAWYTYADGRVGGYHAYPGGQPAIFIRNDAPIALDKVRIRRPDPLPESWNSDEITREEGDFVVA